MPFENWLAFVAASTVMLAIPGPTILLVISYALGHGRKASSATVAGVAELSRTPPPGSTCDGRG